jgi:hypothetical protein
MFLRIFTLQRSLALTASLLLAQAVCVHAATLIPQPAVDGPVGIILEDQYTRFDSRSLLVPTLKGETASLRLVRRYAQVTAAKDEKALRDLYYADDGSKAHVSPLIDQSDTFAPAFKLATATLTEELQWDGLTVNMIALRGAPALLLETAPLL